MEFSEIIYRVEKGVALVTFHRPESLNAWTPTMSTEVRSAMRAAAEDDAVRVIVLTGTGRGFCAGVDLKIPVGGWSTLPLEYDSGDQSERSIFRGRNTYFPAIPKPIIAAINGPCAGIGLSLALFCDMRFGAEEASFTTAFAKRGLIAEHGMAWTLPRLIGASAAADLLYSARKVLAPEAHSLGVIDRIYPKEELLPATMAYATEIAELSSPRSLRVIKQQLWLSQTQSFEESMVLADHEMALSLKSEDHKEGVRHFLEKRPPAFTGR
ncbi:MAG: enoyl-CoA hydratase [Hyphomicrobium sp. SCN 65-11]|mgnify:CR=1 FL=1|nr:MAG: enoyl-CoA hydratase [Hyphomicrobium sp. SCN 65-11]